MAAMPHDVAGHMRSVAATCACAALELSFAALGATISLGQTSRLGAPVWKALGYREFTSYARYLVPTALAHSSPNSTEVAGQSPVRAYMESGGVMTVRAI
jgi:hypothetical protein